VKQLPLTLVDSVAKDPALAGSFRKINPERKFQMKVGAELLCPPPRQAASGASPRQPIGIIKSLFEN
jgi:hypothetical protein